ncbi:RTA1-like protein [Phellopilus nigrolimitatus]|nr:RTA1-like protein [Phellopilus nigrolimitatus]
MSSYPRAPVLLLVALATLPVAVLAKVQSICASDPFADPTNDPCNPLKYIASDVLSGIAFGLYIAVGICFILSTWKWGAAWMAAMSVGIFTFSMGIGCRFGLHLHPQSKGIYIAEYLLVVLSPCAFIAAEYVLLGRLARDLDMSQYLLVSPRRVTPIFVASDVTTFLIQAVGGSVSIGANDLKTNELGSNIFLAGLVLQLASFLVFTLMYLHFLRRIYFRHPETWRQGSDSETPWYNDWRTLASALLVSCVGILIRSVFRVIELSQGFQGAIATNEGDFYGLDTLPLFIAVAIYVPFWPGRFIRSSMKDTTLDTAIDNDVRKHDEKASNPA